MSDSSESLNLDSTNVIELAGKVMVVAIVILLFILLFVFCFHLYVKWFWLRRQQLAADHYEMTLVSALTRGLDPIVLKTLPVLVFDPDESKDGPLECAVCLCEVSRGEKARLLPKCNHGFHLECIDMWFQSHSTCPLCRKHVAGRNSEGDDELASDSPGAESPTNVLYWGDESRVSTLGPCLDEDHNNNNDNDNQVCDISEPSSSSSMMPACDRTADGALVIDIPRQMNEEEGHKSPMPERLREEEEHKSPMPERLRSLKRLLSGNNRRVNPCSPRMSDLEQGGSRSGQS